MVDTPETPPGLLRDLITLTKPRIISLLLVTTVCAMFAAQQGVPNGWLIVWALIGGYMSAGGANTINQFVDRDIDAVMGRTEKRPIVMGRISAGWALTYGLALVAGSVLVFGFGTTWVAAGLSLAGVALYVFLYTLWLKRTTIHNIVIGGAAGAVPPLVGWAAITGDVTLGVEEAAQRRCERRLFEGRDVGFATKRQSNVVPAVEQALAGHGVHVKGPAKALGRHLNGATFDVHHHEQ